MTDPKVSRSCPLCGQNRPEPHLAKRELRLVRCANCSMIYVNPAPSELATAAYYHQEGIGYYLSPPKLESDYADVRFERELSFFRRHCLSGAVLDVGCSSGGFLYQLNKRFPAAYELLGTDVSGPPLDYAASRGIPVFRGDFLTYDLKSRRFAAVTFWAVLEHLLEPARFLERAWSLLEPAGLCFVLVPNMRSLAARLLGARYRYIYSQHLNYFTPETLMRLVEPHFSIIELRSTHFNPLVIWQDWRRRGAEITNRDRAGLLKRTTRYKQNPLLAPARFCYQLSEMLLGSFMLADNLVLVARKKL